MELLINNELEFSHEPLWLILKDLPDICVEERTEETTPRINWDNRLQRQNFNSGPIECKARML
jgi:hypothetical protein